MTENEKLLPYKFRSDITKSSLPTGYIDISRVTREEVPIFLDRIYKKSKLGGGDWIQTMLFVLMKDGSTESWKPQTIAFKAQELYDDVQALMDILIVDTRTPNSEKGG